VHPNNSKPHQVSGQLFFQTFDETMKNNENENQSNKPQHHQQSVRLSLQNKKESNSLERMCFGPGGATICSGESELINHLIVPQ